MEIVKELMAKEENDASDQTNQGTKSFVAATNINRKTSKKTRSKYQTFYGMFLWFSWKRCWNRTLKGYERINEKEFHHLQKVCC